MKIFRRWYWLISGFFKKYSWGILVSVILGVVVFFILTRFVTNLPTHQTLHVGRVGSIQVNQIPLDIQSQMSTGLTQIDEKGQVVLSAASAMAISPDGKTYTFTLKPDLTWADGSPVNTQDLDIKPTDVEVQAPTSNTLVFTLKESYAPFPSVVSQPLLKKATFGKLIKHSRIIGLYPPMITSINMRKQYIDQIRLDSPRMTTIYHFYPTEADSVTAFKLGQIDAIIGLTKTYLSDWPNLKIAKIPQPHRYLALFFNLTDQDLQDKTVRQMLAYAIPKTLSPDRVISPIAKTSWVYNPQVKPYDYQTDTAKAMLQKLKESNANYQPVFTLTSTPAYADVAQSIAASWVSLGIKVNLKIVPYPDTTDYQILLIGQQIPDDPDQYALWHSTQATNISRYKNPKIDKLLEDGRRELNPVKRQEIYQEFQRFLVEDSPAVFIQELSDYNLSRT